VTGWFVAVEGIDGSGKSTVAAQLVGELVTGGRRAVLVDRRTAPGLAGGYPGEHLAGLARLIWDYPSDARTSELGFCHWSRLLAAWFHAVSEVVVRPALAGGAIVIADSWWHKFAARFALTVGLRRARAVFDGAAVPDQVLWLDVPPQVCAQRRTVLRGTERGEWQGLRDRDDGYLRYQRQVRAGFRSMATTGGWQVLPDAADERLAAALELITDRAGAAAAAGAAVAVAGTPA
jgi:thymidylate kinase